MNGLLSPEIQGLLAGAGAGLQASGPSRMPVTLGQIFGQGINAGLPAYRQAQLTDQNAQLHNAQMENILAQANMRKQALAEEQAQQAYLQRPDVQARLQAGDVQGVMLGMPKLGSKDILGIHAAMSKPLGQSIGAGGLRMPDGTIIPPANGKETKPLIHDIPVGNDPKNPQVQPSISLDNGKTWQPIPGAGTKPAFGAQVTVHNAPPEPAPVAVVGPDGKAVWESRSRAIGKPAANLDPTVQGAVAGARTGAQAAAKREFNMGGLAASIQEAQDLLTGTKDGVPGAGTLPTGSMIGAGVDALGGVFGANPSGSIEAAQLKAVSGALVSKMPRMEGPQSDKDVMLYKEMAGKIGDPMTPRAQRVAALGVVKNLWQKYEKPAATSTAPNGGWSIRPKE